MWASRIRFGLRWSREFSVNSFQCSVNSGELLSKKAWVIDAQAFLFYRSPHHPFS